MSLREYAHSHVISVCLALFCTWLSLSLIIRLWLKHRSDPVPKRLLWSLILCVPLFGWLLYGAFYVPLSENSIKAQLNTDAFYGGH